MSSSKSLRPIISVVLGTLQRKEFLQLAIQSIRLDLSNIDHEIIVIDGGSSDGSVEWLVRQSDVLTILHQNRGGNGTSTSRRSWGYFMNLGLKCAQGKFIAMLSDDCLLVPGSIQNAIRCYQEGINSGQKIGGVAFYWRNWPEEADYTVKYTLGNNLLINHGLFLRQALEEVDFIEEDAYAFYHADADLALKLATHGYLIIDSNSSFVEHFAHANELQRAKNGINEKQDWTTFINRWATRYQVSLVDVKSKCYDDKSNTAELFKLTTSGKIYAVIQPIVKAIKRSHKLTNLLLIVKNRLASLFR